MIQQSLQITLSGTCYGYVRVSTNKQADLGGSLDVQEAEIRRYVKYHRYDLKDIYDDAGKSAAENKLKKRKGLKALLDVLQRGDAVIVYTLSRLSRSLREFLQITKTIEEKGGVLILIREQLDSGNPYGNFTINLIALLGQLEIELTKDRNAALLKHRREHGEFVGKIPYGWRIKVRRGPMVKQSIIEECEDEQIVIRYIQALYDDPIENYTYQSIAVKLNKNCVPPPPKSKKWYDTHVKRILNRKSGPGVKYVEPVIIDGVIQKEVPRQPPKPKKREIDLEKVMAYISPMIPFISTGRLCRISSQDVDKIATDDNFELQSLTYTGETFKLFGVDIAVN